METMQELIPLARELLASKRRGLLRLYLLGSVLAVLGALLGLVDTMCSPFAIARRLRERQAALEALQAARQSPAVPAKARFDQDTLDPGSRAPVLRQHAS